MNYWLNWLLYDICICESSGNMRSLFFSKVFEFFFRVTTYLFQKVLHIYASRLVLFGRTYEKESSSSTRFNIVLRPKIFQWCWMNIFMSIEGFAMQFELPDDVLTKVRKISTIRNLCQKVYLVFFYFPSISIKWVWILTSMTSGWSHIGC